MSVTQSHSVVVRQSPFFTGCIGTCNIGYPTVSVRLAVKLPPLLFIFQSKSWLPLFFPSPNRTFVTDNQLSAVVVFSLLVALVNIATLGLVSLFPRLVLCGYWCG